VFRDDIKHSVCQLETGRKKLRTVSVNSVCLRWKCVSRWYPSPAAEVQSIICLH